MKLLALDGNSLTYRAFFALPTDMATASGQVTNAIYGFTSMLTTLMKDQRPDGVVVVFDRKEPTFRHEAAPEYKAQREKQPDILYQQLELVRELLGALGVATLDYQGFEGDDLIATIVDRCERDGNDVVIVTGDRDSYQLVHDPHVRVLYNKRGVSDYALYDEKGIVERTGVTPAQYVDYAALRGDPSDNLDGLPGVGEKTAAKLLNQYGSLKAIIDAAGEQTPKLKAAIIEHADRVVRNAELMRLRRDVPIDVDYASFVPRPDLGRTAAMFTTLEFKNMMSRVKDAFSAFVTDDAPAGVAESAEQNAVVGLEAKVTRGSSLPAKVKREVVVLAGWGSGDTLGDAPNGLAVVSDVSSSSVTWIDDVSRVLDSLSKLPMIVTHDAKRLHRWMLSSGREDLPKVFDVAIAGYLLDPADGERTVGDLAAAHLGVALDASSRTPTGQLSFEESDSDVVNTTCAEALAVARLVEPLRTGLKAQEMLALAEDVEMPLVAVLARMEHLGIGVDRSALDRIASHLESRVAELTTKLHGLAGKEFNINSPAQLRVILFEEKKLQPGKKTKTGFSTDAATLEKIRDQWPDFIDALMEFRELDKLRGTYGEGLREVVASDGRIHATFNQMVARTGRLSSENPNLHNIPVRSDEGKVFRTAFVPAKGSQFLVADYNQIELRCIAHLANDPGLIDAFTKGEDIHTSTAARVFGVAASKVTGEMRSKAKMVSYGLAYGMEAYGLSQRLGIAVDEAAEILDAYFAAFPNVKQYMDDAVEAAKKRGYTVTLFGRRRFIPELNNPNFRLRQIGERQAMNAAIQGLAADIFKIALVSIDAKLRSSDTSGRIVLQVHDEVIVEAKKSDAKAVEEIVLGSMREAASLRVPLEINAAWGDSWASAKS
ncbi:MAG: DNA polymerase I [Actinobacteria bacterium]|nr:DNA polymerase I [Actinomycetota bacterium]